MKRKGNDKKGTGNDEEKGNDEQLKIRFLYAQ